jgi:uncharacterized protein
MADEQFLDANIFLRFLTGTEAAHAKAAKDLFMQLEQRHAKLTTSPLVLFEVVFTLHSRRSYNLPKDRIVPLLRPLIELLRIPERKLWFDAFGVWLEHDIDFTDAYNVAHMRARGISTIYSFDRGYDKVRNIRRVEPRRGEEDDAA